jgi:pimeloyl-ACP methyl ester carboxylesterase
MRHIYLHGFASAPSSRKAQGFRAAFAARDVELEIPALDGGNFEHLTISGQLQLIEELARGEPVQLVGSSMGGYLAALYASRHPETERVVLLAPAFSFSERWQHLLGAEKLAEWRSAGSLEVFHYGVGEQRAISYGLYEDSLQHPHFPDFRQDSLIFHGLADDVVPIGLSRQFATGRGNVELTEMDSGHELTNVLDEIVARSVVFLLGETS